MGVSAINDVSKITINCRNTLKEELCKLIYYSTPIEVHFIPYYINRKFGNQENIVFCQEARRKYKNRGFFWKI